MQQGRGGMGSHKHGISGHVPKSPRARHKALIEAQKNDRKAKPSDLKPITVNELFGRKK